MRDTKFLRSDELPGRAALGYLAEDGPRTNIFHLAVRGSGDGGIYSTAADISSLWSAMFAGRIVSMDRIAEMVRPHSNVPEKSVRYGLGFWLHESRDMVELHGYDAGVSFRSVHDPVERLTHTGDIEHLRRCVAAHGTLGPTAHAVTAQGCRNRKSVSQGRRVLQRARAGSRHVS